VQALIRRARKYAAKELEAFHPRLWVAQFLVGLLPYGMLGDVRLLVYRLAGGFRNISGNVSIAGRLEIRGDNDIYSRLHIGEHTFINTPCFIELNAEVRIGRRVGIGHHLVVITSNHELGPPEERMGRIKPGPVTIGDGAWIGARVTILPGVTIGSGAFIAAGAVVVKDVPANARVMGSHAQVVGMIDESRVRTNKLR
jgi:maltose O-acetyltransferase